MRAPRYCRSSPGFLFPPPALADGLIVIRDCYPEPPDTAAAHARARKSVSNVSTTTVAVTSRSGLLQPAQPAARRHVPVPHPVGAQIDKFSMDIDGRQTKQSCWTPTRPADL